MLFLDTTFVTRQKRIFNLVDIAARGRDERNEHLKRHRGIDRIKNVREIGPI